MRQLVIKVLNVYRIYWLNLTAYKDNSELKGLTPEVTLSIDGTTVTVHEK